MALCGRMLPPACLCQGGEPSRGGKGGERKRVPHRRRLRGCSQCLPRGGGHLVDGTLLSEERVFRFMYPTHVSEGIESHTFLATVLALLEPCALYRGVHTCGSVDVPAIGPSARRRARLVNPQTGNT